MPVRIKPSYDLGSCRLSLEGIKGICERVVRDFPNARFGAIDDIWEIYDETEQTFLEAISSREVLDEFNVSANREADHVNVQVTLGKKEASVCLEASPEYQDWFEHFLIDLRKYLEKPDFYQKLAFTSSTRRWSFEKFSAIMVMSIAPQKFDTSIKFSAPYCRIVIHKRPPNEFMENIKANIVSNIIWALIVFILGVITTLVTTGQIRLW